MFSDHLEKGLSKRKHCRQAALQNVRLMGTPSLHFGKVVVGGTKILTDSVANRSASALTITSGVAARMDFNISGSNVPIHGCSWPERDAKRDSRTACLGSPKATVSILSSAVEPNTRLRRGRSKPAHGKACRPYFRKCVAEQTLIHTAALPRSREQLFPTGSGR
jgi:hypothetical protein